MRPQGIVSLEDLKGKTSAKKKVKKKMAAEAEHYAGKHGLDEYGAEIVA